MKYFYDNDKVKNVSPFWNGKIGTVLRWVHDNWYIVKVDNTELMLDSLRDEME